MNSNNQISLGMTASVAVDRFFRRVLRDPSLAPRFEGEPMHVLAAQQRAFLTTILGCASESAPTVPAVTAGADTAVALAEHLAAALRDAGVPADRIEAAATAAQQPMATVTHPVKPTQTASLPQVPVLPAMPVSTALAAA